MAVRDLEARNLHRLKMKKLPPQARHILLLTASIHIREGRGLTVGDLEKIRFRKHNAEKIIQDARRKGLLIPGDTRSYDVDCYHVAFWPGFTYRYTGERFEISWGDGLRLFRIYSKEHHQNKKMRIRKETQEYPKKPLKDAFMDKISTGTAEEDGDET